MSFQCVPILAALVIGCGCQGRASEGARAPAESVAAQRVEQAAERERARSGTPTPAPLPPGVDASAIAPADPADPRATMALAAALAEVSTNAPLVNENPVDGAEADPQPLSLEQRIEAQAHYVRGREAGLEGRHFLAIQEFEQALAIDPGSTAILRQLARSYEAAGNPARAAFLYGEILALDPAHSEATFALGSSAVRQGRFDQAAALLGRARLREGGFDHDPGANLLADRFLAIALHQLGYPRGELEALQEVVAGLDEGADSSAYSDEIAWMRIRRGEFLRLMGDALCRVGEFDEALRAYREAGASENPDQAALLPRLMYAYVRTGRMMAAQWELLRAARESGGRVDSRLIELAAYLRSTGAATDDLAAALRLLPKDPEHTLAAGRLVAALLPPEQSALELRRIAEANPGSLETIEQLFGALAGEDAASIAALALALAEAHPELAGEHARIVFAEFGLWPELIAELRDAKSASARLLEARLFLLAGAPAEAHRAAEAGLVLAPAANQLHETLIRACCELGEASLLDRALESAPDDDSTILRAIAEAESAIGRRDLAIAAALRAADLAPDDAHAHALVARQLAGDPATAQSAQAAAERALALQPGLDAAFEALLSLYGPQGAQPDQARLQEVINRLRAEAPQGRLFVLLAADERLGQQRFAQVVDTLLSLHERAPEDGEALRRLILAWIQSGQHEAALQWLHEQLAARPHDPNLLQQIVRVRLSRQEFIEAEDILRDRLVEWPEDPLALSMLEGVLQARGRSQEAWALAEERLMRRPLGTRREIERAALRAATGDLDGAIALISPLVDSTTTLARPDAIRILGVVATWQELAASAESKEFLERVPGDLLRRYPDLSLAAYAPAIAALVARGDAEAAEVNDLIDQAIEHADAGPAAQEALQFRAAAQQILLAGGASAAADLLMRRLEHSRALDSQGTAVLVQAAQAALVAAGRAGDLIALLDNLDADGTLAAIFPRGENPRRDALYGTSILATLVGRGDDADLFLLEVLEADPGHAMTLNNLGYHRVERGASDAETADMIERALDLMPDDPSILDTVAWLRYRQGVFESGEAPASGEGALELIERSIERTLESGGEVTAEVLDHRGDLYWRLARFDEAAEDWRHAVELIDDPAFRQTTMQSFDRFQLDNWGIVVKSAGDMFRITYEPILERARAKLRAVEAGEEPPIAPTFAEMREGE